MDLLSYIFKFHGVIVYLLSYKFKFSELIVDLLNYRFKFHGLIVDLLRYTLKFCECTVDLLSYMLKYREFIADLLSYIFKFSWVYRRENMSLDYLKCTEWYLACKMLHKCPLTQNVTLNNAYSKRAFVSCPGQFRPGRAMSVVWAQHH